MNKEVVAVSLGKWLGLLFLVFSLYILWQIRVLVLLLFAAVILATALNRLVRRLQHSGARRGVAIALSIGIVLAFFVCCFTLIATRLTNQFEELIQLVRLGIERLQVWIDWLQAMVPGQAFNNTPILNNLTQQLQTIFNWLISQIYLLFSNSINLILGSLLILVLTVMLVANPIEYRRGLISFFPAFYRQRVDRIISQCEQGLIDWLAGVSLSTIFIGITTIVGLGFLQVPLPVVNGFLAAFFALIPYIGVILMAVPPMLLALLDSPVKAGAVLLLYILIQQFKVTFIGTIIKKEPGSILPAYTLVFLILFGYIFGFLGLFLAVPITIVARVWIQESLIEDVLDRWHSTS
ncbi:MAG: AI-2E family transporter [Oscillatoriaceae cyanobacterium Prado104]|nr:AI-2E family transporter [Oscillatoriaceae cyanobacterium Prado104]